jgi:hypothetical protein
LLLARLFLYTWIASALAVSSIANKSARPQSNALPSLHSIMKTHSTFAAMFLAAFAILLIPTGSAHAQGNEREAADMLRALNIQIGQAQRAGDLERVKLLQNRYIDIQRKWGVRPSPGPRPEPPRVPVSTPWSDVKKGEGKITGYKGGKIRVRSASVNIASFWNAAHEPNVGGKNAVLKFTTEDGTVFSYSGNWTWRGNLTVSLKVGDGEGGFYNGTLNMDHEGISTISLVGYGEAEGYNVTFSH